MQIEQGLLGRGIENLETMEIEEVQVKMKLIRLGKKMITDKISNHIYNFDLEKHPKYIREKIKNIDKDAFGYNAFGIAYNNPRIRDLLNEAKKIIKIYFSRKKFEFKTL